MDLQLTGKRAFVTGSSIGIGEEIARALAAEGATVAVHGRDRNRAARVTAQIAADGGKAVMVTGDLTNDVQVEELCATVGKLLGGGRHPCEQCRWFWREDQVGANAHSSLGRRLQS